MEGWLRDMEVRGWAEREVGSREQMERTSEGSMCVLMEARDSYVEVFITTLRPTD